MCIEVIDKGEMIPNHNHALIEVGEINRVCGLDGVVRLACALDQILVHLLKDGQ